MRQKDVNQLAAIWSKDIEFADRMELPGIESAIGAVIGPLAYASHHDRPLDLEPLRTLVRICKDRQSS